MYKQAGSSISSSSVFRKKIVHFAKNFEIGCILDSNSDTFKNSKIAEFQEYDLIAGFSSTLSHTQSYYTFESLEQLHTTKHNWLLGFLTYDLKNKIEQLTSNNLDLLGWPELFFFEPEVLILVKNSAFTIVTKSIQWTTYNIEVYLKENQLNELKHENFILDPVITREDYLEKAQHIKNCMLRGDLYEMNYCQEFSAKKEIDPYATFLQLNSDTPAPFACFFKYKELFLLSASPERFLKKNNTKITSQPMKGTAPRGNSPERDSMNYHALQDSQKERSENIMIVDLVRNDLSKIAIENSVHVEDLCEVYSLPKVHQMISTISAEIRDIPITDILKATFPMGSMTGAPKISAMKLIEKVETTKRGLYSGSIGYISPENNFDFNVVIRSLQYNAETNYLSYIAGSAITAVSDPEKEYEECLLKVYGLNHSKQNTPND